MLAKYDWWSESVSVRITEVYFALFEDNLQNIVSINIVRW